MSELTGHMIELWRNHVLRLSTDDATNASLVALGDPVELGAIYRNGFRGLCERLLFYESYKLHRLSIPAAACLLHNSIRMASSVQYSVISSREYGYSFAIPNWGYYLTLLFFATMVVPKWLSRVIPLPRRIFQYGALALALWLFAIILSEWGNSVQKIYEDWVTGSWHRPDVENVPVWIDAAAGAVWSVFLLAEGFILFAAVPLVAADIFDFRVWKKRRLKQNSQNSFIAR